VLDAQGQLLRGFTTNDDSWRLPLRPTAVDPLYLTMLTAYEDQRFAWHPGVDPLAVLRAIGQWIRYGRIVSGASTLTMQVARLLEPHPRTIVGKMREMLRALQLEWHFDKDTLLSWYLALAPYGGNLEGLRSASLAYLGKEPLRLTPAEAALLVSLPQAPSRLRPDRFPARARLARDKVLKRMGRLEILTPQQITEAQQESLPHHRRSLPFHAPHLARRLHKARPAQRLHNTFIDGPLQRTLETLALQHPLPPYSSLAILIAENRTRQVIAYLGSVDFFATPRAGQIDMVQAIRSPGSTLKPLVYGMGFEELIIHPETLIDDVPTRFGDYTPSNFRNVYHGTLSVREALQQSLNIPAIAVLERLGPGRVAARLRRNDIQLHWHDNQAKPGLPMVLGGVGVTLEGLVSMYLAIANHGEAARLRFSATDKVGPSKSLLSPAASWYLTRILRDAPPPANAIPSDNLNRPRRIAHKTGTSYGFRDAWALGFDQSYTVGVWVGRPDGSPNPGYFGRNAAAPLLFRIFELLPDSGVQTPSGLPEGVLLASHSELPARLRYFRARSTSQQSTPLKIDFPVAGSQVELKSRAGRLDDLPLVASGGRRPLRWLVNGKPLHSSPLRRSTSWRPDGEGLARITVMDNVGRVSSVEIWINPADGI
jgi:penicillin-binding protein 1C